MKPHKTIGRIHSLDGKEDEITILEKCGDNDYIVDYIPSECNLNRFGHAPASSRATLTSIGEKGVRCHAIFNWFANRYYVSDVYGRIED